MEIIKLIRPIVLLMEAMEQLKRRMKPLNLTTLSPTLQTRLLAVQTLLLPVQILRLLIIPPTAQYKAQTPPLTPRLG